MAHGFGGVRDAGLDAFAGRFADAGILAFAFDYRHFGESGGEPRQLLSVGRQLADWRAAIEHVRGLEEVDADRIALWGTSFSGGHVIQLASEGAGVAACIAQIPFVDGIPVTMAQGVRQSLRLTLAGLRDLARAATGRAPFTLPIVGPPRSLAALTTPDAEPGYQAIVPEGSSWRNEVAARVLLQVPLYRPGRRAAHIECPLLIAIARDDRVTPPEPARRVARRAPRGELVEFDGGHFDLYRGEPFERLVAAETAFLQRQLGVGEGVREGG
jgi:uncharacterized protein